MNRYTALAAISGLVCVVIVIVTATQMLGSAPLWMTIVAWVLAAIFAGVAVVSLLVASSKGAQ